MAYDQLALSVLKQEGHVFSPTLGQVSSDNKKRNSAKYFLIIWLEGLSHYICLKLGEPGLVVRLSLYLRHPLLLQYSRESAVPLCLLCSTALYQLTSPQYECFFFVPGSCSLTTNSIPPSWLVVLMTLQEITVM